MLQEVGDGLLVNIGGVDILYVGRDQSRAGTGIYLYPGDIGLHGAFKAVEEIAVKLGVSESWVYQLLAKGRKIAKKVREDNEKCLKK